MKKYAILIPIIFLGACGERPKYASYENDPQVFAQQFQQCVVNIKGPHTVANSNDWDEAIGACRSAAREISEYCVANCGPSPVTKADVAKVGVKP